MLIAYRARRGILLRVLSCFCQQSYYRAIAALVRRKGRKNLKYEHVFLSIHVMFIQIQACIDGVVRFVPSGKKGKKSQRSDDGTDESAPEPIDLLVDLIIGFMEKSTAYLRTIGNQAFALLSDAVKESTIDLILTVCVFIHPGLN